MWVSALIALKKHGALIWRMVEWGNAVLFRMLHPHIHRTAEEVLQHCEDTHFRYSLIRADEVDGLCGFLRQQSAETLTYFRPHGFDRATLARLSRNRAFVLMKVTDERDDTMKGYFFLRCFCIGRAFHGLLVDESARGRGIGTMMWALASRICKAEGLRMFATISANNPSSYQSCRHGTLVRVVEHLANDYLLVECKSTDA